MYEFTGTLDATDLPAVATGHIAQVMRWEGPEGQRRPGSTPEVDEATNAPLLIADVMLPLGRDGRPELFGVRFPSHEIPDFTPYSPVEFQGLRVKVRASRTGKGVDVSFTADAVRPAAPQRQGRRATSEIAEAV